VTVIVFDVIWSGVASDGFPFGVTPSMSELYGS